MDDSIVAIVLKKNANTSTTMAMPSHESPFLLVTSQSASKESQRWEFFLDHFGIPYKTQMNNDPTSSGGE